MNYDSNQNQGYEPKMSGGNNAGYYMGESNNLMDMMAYGGSAGGAWLAQQMQKQHDTNRVKSIKRQEGERQKKGRTLGSVLAFGGSLLGTAIGGSAGKAIGSAAGKYVGEKLGAGKAKKYSTAGTVYNQQDLRDVSQASRDFNKGTGERAIVSGLTSAARSYLSPGGWDGSGNAPIPATVDTSPMDEYFQKNQPFTSKYSTVFGTPDTGGSLSGITPPASGSTLPFGDAFKQARKGGLDQFMYNNNPYSTDFAMNEDGGLIGFGHGGYTAESILRGQDLDPTEEQLALFQSFDPTKINQAKAGAEQSLLSMTGGQGTSSIDSGFGAQQKGVTSAIESGQEMIGDTTEQAQHDFMSTTFGTAGDIVAGGGNIKKTREAVDPVYGEFDAPPLEDPNWSPPANPNNSMQYQFNGVTYVWDGDHWVTDDQYGSDMDAFYDTQG